MKRLKPVGDLSAELQQTLKQAHGKVYANAREVRDGLKLEPGMQVDFLPKVDENGLVALAIGPPMDPLPQETPDFDGTAPDGSPCGIGHVRVSGKLESVMCEIVTCS